jgi:biopolymer transport protein ExbB
MLGRTKLPFARLSYYAVLVVIMCAGLLWAQTDNTPPGGGERGAPSVAPASPAANPPANPLGGGGEAGGIPTAIDLFMTLPVLNSIILSLSVVAVVLFIYFLMTINTRNFLPPLFLDDVNKLVLSRQYDQAANLCRHHRHIFAAGILQRCIENADKDHETVLSILDAEGKRRADLIWNKISYLIDLSTIAPMLGLLGTVYGMMRAFFAMPAAGSAAMSSRELARSIGAAMSATFLGLMVAIIAVVFYSFIKSRAIRSLGEVESATLSVVDHLKRDERLAEAPRVAPPRPAMRPATAAPAAAPRTPGTPGAGTLPGGSR